MLPTVVVSVALASICFSGNCYNALVGQDTVPGTYQLQHYRTTEPGYGGDVLVYRQTQTYAWAIHRVWLLDPKQHRQQRLASDNPAYRHITMGCINVSPVVYQKLVDCCSSSTLIVNER